jgi:hypothetical protein
LSESGGISIMKKALFFLLTGILAIAIYGCSGGGSGDAPAIYTGSETDSDTGMDDDTYTPP